MLAEGAHPCSGIGRMIFTRPAFEPWGSSAMTTSLQPPNLREDLLLYSLAEAAVAVCGFC